MRSDGQVKFITVSGRLQMSLAAALVAALAVWAASLAMAGWAQYRAVSDRVSLLDREARVATAEERVNAYREDFGAVARDLDKRQAFIEDMVSALPSDIKTQAPVSDSTGPAGETVQKISAALPEAAALARIEARQLAFVEKLTRYADWRAARAERALRSLGLNPQAMLRGADRAAMGGPLEALTTGAGGAIDPRFERLGLSLARMDALEDGLAGVPQVEPASLRYISSGFGFRHDPFTGAGAMHKGLDFRGPVGAPIFAAAKGRVSFVGVQNGYGNTVEIDHGNGLMTRYAHMSRFAVPIGAEVEAGRVIGAIGSTGRSTGPHLHFEVRVHGAAVNPRIFLEKAPDVLKEVRRDPRLARGQR